MLKLYLLLFICNNVFSQSDGGFVLEISQELLDLERFKYGLKMTGTEISCDDDGKTVIQTYQLVYQTKPKSTKNFKYGEGNVFIAGDGGDGGDKVEVYLLQIGFREPLDLSSKMITMGYRKPLMVAPSNRQQIQQPIGNLFRDVFREKKKELSRQGVPNNFEDISMVGYTSNIHRKNVENVFPRFLIWNHSQVVDITTDADLNYFYLDASEFVNVDEFAESVKQDIVKIIDEKNKFYVFISNGKSPIISESKDDYEEKIVNRLYSLRTPYPSLENDYQFLKTKIGNDIILQKESGLVNIHLYISKKFCDNSLMNLIKQVFRSKLNAEGKNERITQAVNLILHIEQENEDGFCALSKCEYVVPSIIEDLKAELDCNCKNE